jgi:lysophospholipase L1-like esterase
LAQDAPAKKTDEPKKDASEKPTTPPVRSATVPASRSENGFWMARHRLLLKRVEDAKPGVIFIGDSITQGWEGAGKEVWKRHYAPRQAVNLGIGGDGTQHVLWRLDHGEIERISPKVAVVMIGTNNMFTNTPEQIAEGNRLIVETLRKKLPDTKILLLAIFPRAPRADDPIREKIKATNALIAKQDDGKYVRFLDIGPAFLEADGSIARSTMPDYLHLTPRGYRVWANAIEPTLWELEH